MPAIALVGRETGHDRPADARCGQPFLTHQKSEMTSLDFACVKNHVTLPASSKGGGSLFMKMHNLFGALQKFDSGKGRQGSFYSLPALEKAGVGPVSRRSE